MSIFLEWAEKKLLESGDTTEEHFQSSLDANPDDWQTRLVFADWLEEHDDPRAEGYRALGKLQKRSYQSLHDDTTWLWGQDKNKSNARGYPNGTLPESWLKLIIGTHPRFGTTLSDRAYWRYHNNRREAEDAAALAFSKLPKAMKTKLLRGK